MNQLDKSIQPLLDDAQVSTILNVSVETLAAWRHTSRVALPFIKVGGRLVRYRQVDVQAFIDAGQQPPAPTEGA